MFKEWNFIIICRDDLSHIMSYMELMLLFYTSFVDILYANIRNNNCSRSFGWMWDGRGERGERKGLHAEGKREEGKWRLLRYWIEEHEGENFLRGTSTIIESRNQNIYDIVLFNNILVNAVTHIRLCLRWPLII